MNVKLSKMRILGIAQAKEVIESNFKYGHLIQGESLKDEKRHRMLRVARFQSGSQRQWVDCLYEPQLVWIKDDRMMLSGTERISVGDQTVEYAQSWMISVDVSQIDKFKIDSDVPAPT